MRLPVFLLLVLASASAGAEVFSARVVAVLDGDTVLVIKNNRPVKIRLADIDAPEKSQDFGAASCSALVEMVLHKQVQASTLAADKYGRTVALLEVDGRNVNEEMVRRGMAWEYSHYHSDRHYLALQKEARQAGCGLWAQPATPPWQWRKQHTAAADVPPVLAPGDYSCGSKHHCAQMRSCNEAHYNLTVCGVKALNPEGNGVPCKNLCARR